MLSKWVCIVTVAALCGGTLGCGGPTTHSLAGRVVYAHDQSPAGDLVGYTVTAVCSDPPLTAVGEVQSDGSFELSTFQEGDGAVAGKYRVALGAPLPFGDEPPPPSPIDARYGDLDKSGLQIEVPSDEVVLTVERLSKRK